MDTIQADKVTTVGLNYLEVEGAILLELLEGVSTHASKDKALTVLNALQVEGAGGLFTARATDRYRLIEGSIKALDGQLDPAIISLEDTKRLITLAKDHKRNLIGLSRVSNTLTVSSLGDSITFTLVDANYPPTAELLSKVESDPIAIEGVAFNPVFFTDYAKIAGKGAAIKVYFGGEGKPMRVRITSNTITWRALLMPMRYAD
jgi:DNA polymerase III sliding clamp (beta) subunit (PCNA family)